ncbi:hypothetical protein KCP73_01545 [Salmonella enterica subsp. enterica]|nr:hypothetical protein KCP73_01545 [Salmonella enterica subsp. enterica]
MTEEGDLCAVAELADARHALTGYVCPGFRIVLLPAENVVRTAPCPGRRWSAHVPRKSQVNTFLRRHPRQKVVTASLVLKRRTFAPDVRLTEQSGSSPSIRRFPAVSSRECFMSSFWKNTRVLPQRGAPHRRANFHAAYSIWCPSAFPAQNQSHAVHPALYHLPVPRQIFRCAGFSSTRQTQCCEAAGRPARYRGKIT